MPIYISFVVLSALLLWAVIYARGPWQLKLALICTVPVFGVVVWHTLEGYKGWPAAKPLPENAALVGQFVDEPRWIYVWAIPNGADKPRAYRIPYVRQAHEAVDGARIAQGKGLRVGIRIRRGRYEVYELPDALPNKGEQ